MFLNNKQTPLQEYKVTILVKALITARAKYQGDNLIKIRPREGKIVMTMDGLEKVIIKRDAGSLEAIWRINADDLKNEEMVRNLVEPPTLRPATGRT